MAGPELDTFQLFLNSLTVGVGDSCSLKFEGGGGGGEGSSFQDGCCNSAPTWPLKGKRQHCFVCGFLVSSAGPELRVVPPLCANIETCNTARMSQTLERQLDS